MGTVTGSLQAVATLRARTPAEGTAGAGGEYAIGRVPNVAGSISGARYIPDATVTANGTNFKVLTIVNKGTGGAGTQSTASLSTAAVDKTAFDDAAFTLDATAANRDVVAGSMLTMKSTVTAGGVALPAGVVEVDFTRD